ncbi:MAG TPA: hypothetical protein VGL86_00455 [Polyangia bacterium]|jgi:hypothetical protein
MPRTWLLPLVFVAGCYSYGLQKPDTPPVDAFGAVGSAGRICVLRPHWNASAVTAVVHDNDALVGATRGPTYFCYAAQPGRHVISSKADVVEQATLDVEAGRRYFLHQIVDNIFGVVRTRLAWVDEGEAARLIGACGYRVLTSVPANERLPTSAPVPAEAFAGAP